MKGGRIGFGEVTFQDAGILQKEGVNEERHPPSLGLISGTEHFLLSYVEGFVPEGAESQGRVHVPVKIDGPIAISRHPEYSFACVYGVHITDIVSSAENYQSSWDLHKKASELQVDRLGVVEGMSHCPHSGQSREIMRGQAEPGKEKNSRGTACRAPTRWMMLNVVVSPIPNSYQAVSRQFSSHSPQ